MPAAFDLKLQSWDMAFKDTKASDYVVGLGQVWGRLAADKFMLAQVRDRMNFPETLQAVLDLSRRYPEATTRLVEDKANSPVVIAALQGEIAGLIPVEPMGSKEARAAAASPQVESGNVYLPHPFLAPWVEAFIDELAAFPKGSHDDQVDATSQALNRLGTGLEDPDPICGWADTVFDAFTDLPPGLLGSALATMQYFATLPAIMADFDALAPAVVVPGDQAFVQAWNLHIAHGPGEILAILIRGLAGESRFTWSFGDSTLDLRWLYILNGRHVFEARRSLNFRTRSVYHARFEVAAAFHFRYWTSLAARAITSLPPAVCRSFYVELAKRISGSFSTARDRRAHLIDAIAAAVTDTA